MMNESGTKQADKQQKRKVIKQCVKIFLGEFLGTAILMFIGCMGLFPFNPPETQLVGAMSFGFAVFTSVQIFAHISNAYINPSVTILAVLCRIISAPIAVLYIIAEFLGAIMGVFLLKILIPETFFVDGFCLPVVHPTMSYAQGFFVELALGMILALFCCAVWDPKNQDKQESVSVKFGLLIGVLSLVAGRFTGTCLNTARYLAPLIYASNWDGFWIYFIAPNVAPFVAFVIYKYFFTEKDEKYDPVIGQAEPTTSKIGRAHV